MFEFIPNVMRNLLKLLIIKVLVDIYFLEKYFIKILLHFLLIKRFHNRD